MMSKHKKIQVGHVTTMQASTLLSEFYEGEERARRETVALIAELENTKNVDIRQWFPKIDDWNIEEVDRERGFMRQMLASKWSLQKTTRFYRGVDKEVSHNVKRGKRMFRGKRKMNDGTERVNELELGLGLHKLIEIANLTYGVSNWMTQIGESRVEEYEVLKVENEDDGNDMLPSSPKEEDDDADFEVKKEEEFREQAGLKSKHRCNLVMKTTIRLMLADNTVVEKDGYGYSYNLPREMAFRKCKKESVSDGLKSCFGGLVFLLFDYEEKVRSGYYKKYV